MGFNNFSPSIYVLDNKFLELPDTVKSKSIIIWHQAVDEETLKTFRKLGVGVYPHSSPRSVKDETIKRKLIANHPGVLNYAISETVRSSLIKSEVVSEDKISIIQIPPALASHVAILKEFGERGDGNFIVLIVSRISPEKGLENVLEIYKHVFDFTQTSPEKCSRPINFLVVGSTTIKSYEDLIINKVKLLPISTACSIEFLGQKSREDLAELYMNSHILLMPSLFDSWGLVTTEALHYGLPIVAFGTPGTKEIFSKSRNKIGMLIDNSEEGAKAIVDITTNKDLWLSFSEGALNESTNYQPKEISLKLLQRLWNDKYQQSIIIN